MTDPRPLLEDPSTWVWPDEAEGLRAFRLAAGADPDSAFDLKWFRMYGRRVGEQPGARAKRAPQDKGSHTEDATGVAAREANDPRTGPGLPLPVASTPPSGVLLAWIEAFAKGEQPCPAGLDPIEAYGWHAIRRAKERYGIDLGPADILAIGIRIEQRRDVQLIFTTKRGHRVWEVGYRDHRLRAAYDHVLHAVTTFLSLPKVEDAVSAASAKADGASPAPEKAADCKSAASGGDGVDDPMPELDPNQPELFTPGPPARFRGDPCDLTVPGDYGNNKASSGAGAPAETGTHTTEEDTKMPTDAETAPAAPGAKAPAAVPTDPDIERALTASLIAVQGEMETAKRNKTNTYHGSEYADFEAVMAVARPCMVKHGLALTQQTEIGKLPNNGEGWLLRTTIRHTSGGQLTGLYPLTPVPNMHGVLGPQETGSAVTYARRYAFAALLGVVVADEDDDANRANGNEGKADTGLASTAPKLKVGATTVDPHPRASGNGGPAAVAAPAAPSAPAPKAAAPAQAGPAPSALPDAEASKPATQEDFKAVMAACKAKATTLPDIRRKLGLAGDLTGGQARKIVEALQ